MLGGVALTTNPNALRPNVADGYSPDPRRSKPAYSITSSARASKDGRHGQSESFRGPEVDCKQIFGRRLHRHVGGILALENAIDVARRCAD